LAVDQHTVFALQIAHLVPVFQPQDFSVLPRGIRVFEPDLCIYGASYGHDLLIQHDLLACFWAVQTDQSTKSAHAALLIVTGVAFC
jgi:hypothetical protein